jgi:hypothetical protein
MEAKEKAKELIDKYKPLCGGYWGGKINKEFAKQSAIISVNEICEAIHYHYDDSTDIEWKYWQEVKREINNL